MLSADLLAQAEQVLEVYRTAGRRLVIAESCTGGLICGCLTAMAGSSAVVERGYVTYSNQAKLDDLGVAATVLARFGAVSAETVSAMAAGALARSPAEVALSVSGVAGPGGGTQDKPVGLVFLGLARRHNDRIRVERHIFSGDRTAVRLATVRHALILLLAGCT